MTSCQQGLHLAAPLTSIVVAISSLSANARRQHMISALATLFLESEDGNSMSH